MFDDLKIGLFSVRLVVEQPMRLPPYKGSVLRGGFGSAFRRVSCALRASTCDGCLMRSKCPYGYVFETSPAPDAQALRALRDVPRPFVIEPPEDDKTAYEPGENLEFGLVLVGDGISYLPYFIVAFRDLGRTGIGPARSRFDLVEVRQRWAPEAGDGGVVFSASHGRIDVAQVPSRTLDKTDVAAMAARLPGDSIGVEFKTMTRLKTGASVSEVPAFPSLARALLRRVSSLAYFHHGVKLELDYAGLTKLAYGVRISRDRTRWVDWTRHSNRQGRSMNLGGIVGHVTYEGDLAPFRELLALGSIVHVGKNTTFGLGRYVLSGW